MIAAPLRLPLLLAPVIATPLLFSQDTTAPAAETAPTGPAPSPAPGAVAEKPAGATTVVGTLVYLEGDYGLDTDTEIWAALVTAEYDAARWRVAGTVPFLTVEGPAIVTGAGSAVAPRPTTERETGFGDITAEATWKLLPSHAPQSLDLTGRVKFPTADEDRGLGTGEFDYYVQLDTRRVVGGFSLFANVGWQFLGDPSAYELEDGPYATLGAARPIDADTTLGASLSWRSATSDGTDDACEAVFFASRQLTAEWRLLGLGIVGFTDASPDFGAGLAVSATY